MGDFSQREKKLLLALAGVCLLSVAMFIGNEYRNKKNQQAPLEQVSEGFVELGSDRELKEQIEEDRSIFVHISGAVLHGGLIELKEGDRLVDAIELAGGTIQGADLNRVNLSKKLQDEERIHIPLEGELDSPLDQTSQVEASPGQGKVRINSCDKSQLIELPGIGEKTAEKIIDYRQKQPFRQIEDLKEVPGIGDKKFEELKDKISL